MSPEEVRQLRRSLKLTAKQLAERLGVDQKLVFDWEKGARFPTKRYCDAMAELGKAVAVSGETAAPPDGTWALLADPDLWALLRKLLASPELLAKTKELAAGYPDPADD